jgi:hypothetical protein
MTGPASPRWVIDPKKSGQRVISPSRPGTLGRSPDFGLGCGRRRLPGGPGPPGRYLLDARSRSHARQVKALRTGPRTHSNPLSAYDVRPARCSVGPHGEPSETLRANGGLQHRPPPQRLVPPDLLGHLMHRVQLQCPEELGVMMCEVSLDRVEQLLLGSACKLRPAFADDNPPVTVHDFGQIPLIVAVSLLLVRPTDLIGL